jgi:predicted dehydrogenase
MENSKICLIGYGYWGKILHKNILNLGLGEVKIVDEVLGNMNEITDSYDYYFVATPFTSHIEVLNKLSKFRNKKIWCEKPLAPDLSSLEKIYNKLSARNNNLFVDWVYLYNPAVDYLSEKIKNKGIKQIILNRTNDGPIRNDCTSIWDLSSHDLSIILEIFRDSFDKFCWNEFSIKTHEEVGSNVSWTYSNGTQIIINSSWQHQKKNRVSIFITDDDEIIVFDDIKKTVSSSKGDVVDFSEHQSPLEMAMEFFINSEDFSHNRWITENITSMIENATQKEIEQ